MLAMEPLEPQVAKRHHTLPQFYLRGFAKDDKLSTVALPGDRQFTQSVKDASVAKNFYALKGHPDGADVIEKALSDVEGATATVFRTISSGTWPLSREDRMTLGYFIALQAARVPVQRRTRDHLAAMFMRLQIGAGGKQALRKQLEGQGHEASAEEVERLWQLATRAEGPPVSRPVAEHLEEMFKLADELLKYIVGRPWLLVKFERRSIITCDDPVVLVGDPTAEPWEGVGFMTAWGITYPLSRKFGLLMSSIEPVIEAGVPVEFVHGGNADMTQVGTTQFEKFFNAQTVVGASEWVFHHPDDNQFLPTPLPDPRPHSIETSGLNHEFTGEPWFSADPARDATSRPS
jgi:hypothetical protein